MGAKLVSCTENCGVEFFLRDKDEQLNFRELTGNKLDDSVEDSIKDLSSLNIL